MKADCTWSVCFLSYDLIVMPNYNRRAISSLAVGDRTGRRHTRTQPTVPSCGAVVRSVGLFIETRYLTASRALAA